VDEHRLFPLSRDHGDLRVNTWAKGDDAAVCLSYRDHGVKAAPELLAALSHLTPGSIGTRLQNVGYLGHGPLRMRPCRATVRPGLSLAAARPWIRLSPDAAARALALRSKA
jgi:hypothetical protein